MRTNLLARLTFPFLATSLLAVAPACDKDEVELDADFAKATHEQRQIAVGTATGEMAGAAMFLTAIIAEFGEEGGGCPKITRDGDKITIKGGCAVEDGRIEGTATIEGSESDGELSMSWDNFSLKDEDSTLRIDGSLTVTSKGRGGEIDANLEFDVDGKGGKLDGVLSCDASEKCTAEDDTVISVKGLGGAAVKGTWSTGDDSEEGVRSGALELHGKNVLKVDFTKQTSERCYAATVDGAPIEPLCEDIDDDTFEATAKRAAASFQARTTR
jgi:hypothetical protein